MHQEANPLAPYMPPADWKPQFNPWRHGGWYVSNVHYVNGAIGCVSNNYDDGRWRIACDDRDDPPTFRTRDEAARAEYALAAQERAMLAEIAPQLRQGLMRLANAAGLIGSSCVKLKQKALDDLLERIKLVQPMWFVGAKAPNEPTNLDLIVRARTCEGAVQMWREYYEDWDLPEKPEHVTQLVAGPAGPLPWEDGVPVSA